MTLGIGLWVTTLSPERAIATLPGQKAEEDTVVAAMRIDTAADDPIWTGATGLRAVEAEIGNAEAARVTPAAGWDQGNHLGLSLTQHIDLGARWATPASLIHNQVRRQRLVSRLELTYDRGGGLTIGGAAGQGYTGANTGRRGADHGVDAKGGRAALVLAKAGLQVKGTLTAIGAFVVGWTFGNASSCVGGGLIGDDLAHGLYQHIQGSTLALRACGQYGRGSGQHLLSGGDDPLKMLLALVRGVPARWMAQEWQVEDRQHGGHGDAGRPGSDEPYEQVSEQMDDADGGRGRTGHGKGIHDLGCAGSWLRVNLVEKGGHIGKQGGRCGGGHPGMKAIEGAMVRGWADKWQADEGANEQIGGEKPLKLGVSAGVGPSTHELGTHQLVDRKGRWSARTSAMGIGGTGSDDCCQVIVLGDLNQWMLGAAREDLTIDQGREPSQNWCEETADQVLDAGWNVG